MPKRRFFLFFLGFLAFFFLSSCKPQITRFSPISSVGKPDWIVIETTQEGVYKISISDIHKAGLEIDSIHPESIEIWRKGKNIPFQEVDQGKALLFYARPPTSEYSASDYYWLVLSEDREQIIANLKIEQPEEFSDPYPMEAVPPLLLGSPDRVLRSFNLEENLLYTPQVEAGDHWLWETYSAPYSQSIEIDLPDADGGGGRLKVWVWARTEGPGAVDHHWQMWLNDQFVGDYVWDGKGVNQFSSSISSGLLLSGKNRLEIRALHDTGLKADIVFLDKIQLDYSAFAQPQSDRMVFYAFADSFTLRDFTGSIAGFQVDPRSGDTTALGMLENGGTLATDPGEVYWLAGPNDLRTPDAIYPAWIDLELFSSTLSANYLAIAPKILLSPLEPLLQFHTAQGIKTRAVPVESIFNQFNGSYPEPQAIQQFMKYVADHGTTPLQYLLLVGDSTFDPRGYLGSRSTDLLPSFFVDTIFGGQTASDVPFSYLDNDDLPDLAVGRVPASTPEQVRAFVNKTLTYLRSDYDDDSQSILAIADGQDPGFRADASRFLELFPPQVETQLLAPPAGSAQASHQVVDEMLKGHWLVAYFGHGSIDTWGRDRLLTTADVNQLNDPSMMPIVVNMTCLTGLFTHPELESLSEAMLFQEPGGAVAVLAPTSLTLPGDQSYLSEALMKSLFSSTPAIIGDVVLKARRSIPLDYPGSKDVLLTFLYFGDPALRIR